MKSLEKFLINYSPNLTIVGGSPLFKEKLPDAISINGFHKECSIAAINGNRSDVRRTTSFEHVIAPNTSKRVPDSVLVPENKYALPTDFPGRMPTTYFSLALICNTLEIPTDVFAICGLASKYHYGDWEMWYMKYKMKWITIHDPRPRW